MNANRGKPYSRRSIYPDFGANPAVAIPICAFATGMEADCNPKLVAGQMNVIDSLPEDSGYSAFWRVNLGMVPAGYQAKRSSPPAM